MRALCKDPSNVLITRSKVDLDLRDQSAVRDFFAKEKIDLVYLAAARVGGIQANMAWPVEFLQDNLLIQTNVISSAFQAGVRKLVFISSNCAYPKNAPQPMTEECLLEGPPEPTNEPYAIAKIAGMKLCQAYSKQYGESDGIDYRTIVSASLYGPGDNYATDRAHVIPALISRFHDAKISNRDSVGIWGSGAALREFLYVDDLAKLLIQLSKVDRSRIAHALPTDFSHINVGSQSEISIRDLALVVGEVVGFKGAISFDTSKPDGAARKLLCSQHSRVYTNVNYTSLRLGLTLTYQDFLGRRLGCD